MNKSTTDNVGLYRLRITRSPRLTDRAIIFSSVDPDGGWYKAIVSAEHSPVEYALWRRHRWSTNAIVDVVGLVEQRTGGHVYGYAGQPTLYVYGIVAPVVSDPGWLDFLSTLVDDG